MSENGSNEDRNESVKERLKQIVDSNKQVVGIVIVLAMLALIGAPIYWFENQRADILRYIVIFLLSIIPAVMYFIFIALKKSSLLQEYISNLRDLGLLHLRHDLEQLDDLGQFFILTRVQGYLKRFEAVYGPVEKNMRNKLLAIATHRSASSEEIERSAISMDDAGGQIFSMSTAIPVFLATILIFVGWVLFLFPGETEPAAGLVSFLKPNISVVLFGFLGAYFFSLQMLFRRFVVNDLRAKAYISVSIRIILAVIGAWVLESFPVADDNTTITGYLPLMAFVIGVFPPVLWRYVRTVLSKIPFSRVPDFENKLPITDLDGLTIWHQARLEEEDIENGFNMANTDIIQLMLNTKIPVDRIIDWVDQALLLSCINYGVTAENPDAGEYKRLKNRLQQLGIRTATMLDQFKSADGQLCDDANDALAQRGFNDAEIRQLIGVANAVENYANLGLVRSWKSSLNPQL